MTIKAAKGEVATSVINDGLSFELCERSEDSASNFVAEEQEVARKSLEFETPSKQQRQHISVADPRNAIVNVRAETADSSVRKSVVSRTSSNRNLNRQPNPLPPVRATWGRAYATIPLSYSHGLSVKSIVLDIISDMYIFQDEMSAYLLIARILDLAHGTHGLQSALLLNPRDAVSILRKKLVGLGYDAPEPDDRGGKGDRLDAFEILEQVQTRLLADMRLYFEFTIPAMTEWCVGRSNPMSLVERCNWLLLLGFAYAHAWM